MRKIILLIAAPIIFLTGLPAQTTQKEADNIVFEWMSQNGSPYIIYAKAGLQTAMTITTSNNEELELDYPCWVYYVKHWFNPLINYVAPKPPFSNGRYLIVKENSGNVLEVKTFDDSGPEDLDTWRLMKPELGTYIETSGSPCVNEITFLDSENLVMRRKLDSEGEDQYFNYKIHENSIELMQENNPAWTPYFRTINNRKFEIQYLCAHTHDKIMPHPMIFEKIDVATDTITLGYQQIHYDANGDFKLQVDSVSNDSRCPITTNCTWEGNVEVYFDLISNENSHTKFTLNLNPKFRNDTVINNLHIKLCSVTPHLEPGKEIEQKDYVVKVLVTPFIAGQSNCDQNVIISADEYENAPNDYLNILNMQIVDDCLKIKFNASGCSGNSWIVKLIDQEDVAHSNPIQRTLRLSLDNKEACLAVITKEVSFNIKDLQVEGTNKVLLNISGDSIIYEYERVTSLPIEDGTYSGTFTVTRGSEKNTRNTSLKLENGTYSCTTRGSGNYSVSNNKIIFNDENNWTADFDWNLILNGEYDYTFDGKRLHISANKDSVAHYEYDLEKEDSITINDFILENYYDDARQLYFNEIMNNSNHPNYNNPELDENEIDKILEIIRAVYNSASSERDTVFDIHQIHEYCRHQNFYNSISLRVNTGLPAIQNLSQGIIPTGDEELDRVLAAYTFDSVSLYYSYPDFPWLIVWTKNEYNMIPVEKEFNELESVQIAEFEKGCVGDGDRIRLIRENDSAKIVFSIGRGDCPAGCMYHRYWEFNVSGGVATFIRSYDNREPEIADTTGTQTEEPAKLQGTQWKLTGIMDMQTDTLKKLDPVDCEECYTLTFDTDSTFSAFSSANQLQGTYEADYQTNSIHFLTIGGTKIGEIADGHLFWDIFYLLQSFSFTENELRLFYEKDGMDYYLLFGKNENNEEETRPTSCAEMTIDYVHYVCADSLCKAYQNSWKEIFIEKNGITEQYFNDHVTIYHSSIDDWEKGTSISISYTVTADWAIAHNTDQFIIKIEEGDSLYPSLDVPRGVFLSKEDIKTIIAANAFSSGIIKFTPGEALRFGSKDEAITFLTAQAKVSSLCLQRIYIDKITGHISLYAGAEYDDEWNKCIEATLDLINGEYALRENACLINK